MALERLPLARGLRKRAEALGLDAVIGAQELQESRSVIGAHGAADAQLAEGRSGQTEAYVAMAVEEVDGLAQRGVVELETGHAPSEPLGDFRCGNRDDGGSGSVGGEIGRASCRERVSSPV